MTTTTYHILGPETLDKLAEGGGGPAAIDELRSAQLSKHLLLARYLLEQWPGPASERDAIADALDRARTEGPDRFAETFGAPLVGAWSAITAQAGSRGQASEADFRHLGAVTMVACAAAGVDGEASAPIRDNQIAIPGLGVVVAPPTADAARLVAGDGRLTVYAGDTVIHLPHEPEVESSVWLPVRSLAGAAPRHSIALSLDDLDPYRHGHHAPPAPRLAAAEVDLWRRLFAEAWQLLAEHLPERAAELAAGLRTLVPLQQKDRHTSRSATIRHAFGVFGLTRPQSAADFAVTLVHEFQHSKLSAILDLTSLSDPQDTRRYFAPWRTDPRPLAGLLQGVYAFVGVADTWRALRAVDGMTELAEQRFAEARLQVDSGLAAIEQSGALTTAGGRLATRLRHATDTLLASPVPIATAQAAERALEQTRRQWLERNRP
ncbi:HEXXH motif domain-containing protein [Allorhizocola rhizosphaerae]|uniref:HEXXH motif domain-containing protein n=1 Tax=Allorhizocola rhizosphaerae TaxID=1872709 RepID=UPI000E3D3D43|nr:HEXXH motif domain-containing protein [Allorhizocola rhizosphaerae]